MVSRIGLEEQEVVVSQVLVLDSMLSAVNGDAG